MIIKLFCSKTAQKSLIFITFFIFSISVFSQNEFITTWKTDNPGTSNATSITIPTFVGETYSYDVDWDNNGTFDEFGLTGNVTHDFTSTGTYTIRIQGTFPRIYFNGGGDAQKIISIDQWGDIAWSSMSSAFYGTSNLVGNATDTPDLSNVTDMSFMFVISAFNQNISAWDTSTVTNMAGMFASSPGFNNGGQPLTWNTAAVTSMNQMFVNTQVFNQDISSWITSSVTNMYAMFQGAVFNQDIGSWDTSEVTDMRYMFAYSSSFDQDLGSWNVEKVANFESMFDENTTFNNGGQPLTWNTIGATNLSYIFRRTTVFNQDLSAWSLGTVTNWVQMFQGASAYNNGGLPLTWDISGLTSLSQLFAGAPAFNQDLSSWDISNITNFNGMFYNASAYNNGGVLLNWDVTGKTTLGGMFDRASAFNQDISGWNVASNTDFGFMFSRATAFNQDISGWNTQAAQYMNGMFIEATAFNQDISSWDTSSVISMYLMFEGASTFNQDIASWDTSLVENMSRMFKNTIAFDQNIGNWNVENVANFYQMFNGATISQANYDALLIGWDAQNLSPNESFDAGNSQFCSTEAQAARTHMMNPTNTGGDGWTITDGGLFGGTCDVLGVEDNELDSVLVYPNPTKGNVTISLTSSASYSLVSMLGQEIQKGTFNFGDNTLDVSHLSKGLYFLNVNTSNGSATKKIIKQ